MMKIPAGQKLVLGALFLVLSCIHLDWIREDQTPMPMGDSYVYLANLLDFLDEFASQDAADTLPSLSSLSHGGRPPGYQLLTIPFILLFGSSEDTALYVNLVFLALLLISTFNIGRLVKNENTGLLAAFLVVTYPPLVQLSRVYLPYFALPACLALSLWLMLLIIRDRSVKAAWFFGASLALGLLIHPEFLRVAAVPSAVMGVYTLLFQTRPRYPETIKHAWPWLIGKLHDPFALRGLLPGALLALGPTLLWYLNWGLDIYRTLETINSPQQLAFRGSIVKTFGFSQVRPYYLWYVLTAPNAISNILAVFALIGFLYVLFKPRTMSSMLMVTMAAGYITSNWFKVVVYSWLKFAAILPVAASLSALWVNSLRPKWLSRALTFLCVTVATFNYSIVTWGVPSWGQRLANALGAHECTAANTASFCPLPARTERWPLLEIEQQILADPKCQEGDPPCQLMVVNSGVGFSAATFGYYLLMNQSRGMIKISSQGVSAIFQPYNFAGLLNSDYVLYLERPDFRRSDSRHSGPRHGKRLSSYVLASNAFLSSPPNAFAAAHQKVSSFNFPNRRTAILIKRTQPLTIEEAAVSIAALELPEVNKTQKYEILSSMYVKEGDWDKAIGLYKEAIEHSSDAGGRTGALHGLSRVYRKMGQPERAKPLYQQILKIDPDDVRARKQLAKIHASSGDSEEAINELETAIAFAPADASLHRLLANLYLSLGQLDRAIGSYQETLEIDPKDLGARVRLAETYQRAGNTSAAISELETAIVLAPDNPRPRRVLARYKAP